MLYFLLKKIMKIATPHIISDCYIFSEKKRKSVQVNQRLTVKAYKSFCRHSIAPFSQKQGAYALVNNFNSFNSLDKKGQNSNV